MRERRIVESESWKEPVGSQGWGLSCLSVPKPGDRTGFGPCLHTRVPLTRISIALAGRGSAGTLLTSSVLQRARIFQRPEALCLADCSSALFLDSRSLTFRASESLLWMHPGSWPARPPCKQISSLLRQSRRAFIA